MKHQNQFLTGNKGQLLLINSAAVLAGSYSHHTPRPGAAQTQKREVHAPNEKQPDTDRWMGSAGEGDSPGESSFSSFSVGDGLNGTKCSVESGPELAASKVRDGNDSRMSGWPAGCSQRIAHSLNHLVLKVAQGGAPSPPLGEDPTATLPHSWSICFPNCQPFMSSHYSWLYPPMPPRAVPLLPRLNPLQALLHGCHSGP